MAANSLLCCHHQKEMLSKLLLGILDKMQEEAAFFQ